MYNVPPHFDKDRGSLRFFEKSFNEFDTKVDVIQLAVGIQLLVQHVHTNQKCSRSEHLNEHQLQRIISRWECSKMNTINASVH